MYENIINYRYNIMKLSSITAFTNLMSSAVNNNCKDVCFVRMLGESLDIVNDIKKLDTQMNEMMSLERAYYNRVNALPILSDMAEIEFYTKCYADWIAGDKKEIKTHVSATNQQLSAILSRACVSAMEKFAIEKNSTTANGQAFVLNESMTKNYFIKLMYWFDYVMKNTPQIELLNNRWDEKVVIKIVAHNIEKVQEYLFYYMLTLVGAHVLLVQNKMDVKVCDALKSLSDEVTLGEFGTADIPKYELCDINMLKQKIATKNSASVRDINNVGEHSPHIANTDSEQKIVVHIPERNRRKSNQNANAQNVNTQNENAIQNTTSNVPQQSNTPVKVNISRPDRANTMQTITTNAQEKSFEELAQLASSIVMITIHNDKGEAIGGGSGIMIGTQGFILTNNHVASGGKYYTVHIEGDETEYKTSDVIKYHYVLDLAIIRINRTLSPLKFYKDSKKLVRGQKVVAIGSPLGLFNSVSDGIISGFRRIRDVDMIQFTAPTSHGSSGGAVLNMYGEVIGISTAGFDDGQNLNLAVGYEDINPFISGFID